MTVEIPPGERTFRIRRYECDAYGHVNNTTYLRYLEEVELAAGLEPGGDTGLKVTDIEYLQPRQFGDEITVSSHTEENMQAVPLRRRYEFRDAASGNLVAHGVASWGTSNTGNDDSVVVPPAPEPAPEVFTQRRLVEWRDVDVDARVSPATFSAFAEDCGVDLCAAYGWSMQRCTDEGFAMVLRRHQISYGAQAGLGDELEIRTWASDLQRVNATRHYVLTSGGKHVARFRSRYVWLDISTMRPIRIPGAFLEDFRPNFSPPANF